MDAFAVPGDVLTVLTAAGLRPAGSLGPTAWLATAGDGDDLVELHVVPAAFDDRLAARAAALSAVRDDHLPRVRTVVPLGPGRCGLLVDHVPGLALGRLRAARTPLSDGEAVTVAVPVAGALAALHRAGLAHGAVHADSIVVQPDGRPVLTDLRGTLLGGGTPDEDVRRLLATVLDVLPSADAELLAGAGTRSAGGASITVRDELEGLLAAPAPSAGEIVERCFGAADPEPVRLPDAGAVVWAEVSDAADRGEGSAERPAADAAPTGASRRARRTDARGRRGRRPEAVERRGAGPRVVAVAVVAVVCVAAAVVVQARHSTATAGPPSASASPGPDLGPVAAAEQLTRDRARALAALDADALAAIDAPGSPALAADRALVGRLDAARLDGVRVEVTAAPSTQPGSSAQPGPSSAAVTVTSATSAYVRVDADGTRTDVPASRPRTVVLDLRLGADGWRVWDVRAPG